MPGMPSCRHMEHKNSYDGNYKRYEENLSKLFESPGKMKSGDKKTDTNSTQWPPCDSCSEKCSDCGRVIIRESSMCRVRRGMYDSKDE
jgi:hypothetical protein